MSPEAAGDAVSPAPSNVAPHEETPEERRERMRELGRRGAEARWRKAAERAAGIESGKAGEDETPVEDIRALGLAELKRLVRSRGTPDAVKRAAAEALLHWQGQQQTEKPRSVQQLEALSDGALDVLLRSLERAHDLPTVQEAAPLQAPEPAPLLGQEVRTEGL